MYKFESRVRYSEADEKELLSTIGIINYFQDCSTFQSEDLGLGLAYLHEHHIAWLVNFWQIEIKRYPKVGESIRVGTSPYDFKGFMGYRNFLLETAEGEQLAIANSVWSLMNMETMRPERLPEVMKERYVRNPKMDMEYAPRKIALPEGEGVLRTDAAPVIIGEHHLDSNHHVNNSQYVQLATDIARSQTEQTQAIRSLLVEYKKQAHLGDTMFPVLFREENAVTIALCEEEDHPETAYAVVKTIYHD